MSETQQNKYELFLWCMRGCACRSHNKNGRRKESKNGFKRKHLHHKPVGRPRTRWADVVQRDALQLLGIRDGGEELKIVMNGGVLWVGPRPGRGCSVIYGWKDERVCLASGNRYFGARSR